MSERKKPSLTIGLSRRGAHTEPSRLDQVEDAMHRLTKKVGKLNRERKDMKDDYDRELAALQETRAALAAELAELQKIRVAFEGEVKKMRKRVRMLGEDEDEDETEYEPPDPGWSGEESSHPGDAGTGQDA